MGWGQAQNVVSMVTAWARGEGEGNGVCRGWGGGVTTSMEHGQAIFCASPWVSISIPIALNNRMSSKEWAQFGASMAKEEQKGF